MSQYQHFIFQSFDFDPQTKTLALSYSFDNQLSFAETYSFDFDFVENINQQALDRAFQNLFFMAGVSYYKAYPDVSLVVEQGELDQETADFFAQTYKRGLGEFYFINKRDPNPHLSFPVNTDQIAPFSVEGSGLLVGLGGGKDSLVTVEALRTQPKVATWSLNHRAQLEPLVSAIGLPHFWVTRGFDHKIIELNKKDALNGHVPISAIFSCVGTIVSILTGYKDAVVSNESSANEPTLQYRGQAINHQFSKSSAYEQAYQQVLARHFGDSLRYYSFLRPLSELHIAELFAKKFLAKYVNVFSSCNRAFTLASNHMSWCGECSKCAFTYLALSPFVEPAILDKIWGKNLLLDQTLESTYRQLLGIEGDKPLDCVGEIKESRAAMKLAQQTYPQLVKYSFELPSDYNFRTIGPHNMPGKMFGILQNLAA